METPKEGRSVSDAQVGRKLRTILGPVCSPGVRGTLPPPTIARMSGAPICGPPAPACMARGATQQPSCRMEGSCMRDPCGRVQANDGALMVSGSIRRWISAAIPVEGKPERVGSAPRCASCFPSIGQVGRDRCRRLISPRRCGQSGSGPAYSGRCRAGTESSECFPAGSGCPCAGRRAKRLVAAPPVARVQR